MDSVRVGITGPWNPFPIMESRLKKTLTRTFVTVTVTQVFVVT